MKFLLFLFLILSLNLKSQSSFRTNIIQNLNFGAFIQGSGVGKITIDSNGSRTSTGSAYLSNLKPYNAAIIQVEALPHRLITIVNGPDIYLTSTTGGQMELHIGESNPLSPYINPNNPGHPLDVYIGGTIITNYRTIGGEYSGFFSLTFIEQ